MIDLEVEIYDKIYEETIKKFPKITIASEYVRSPSSFPFVSIVQISNTTYERTLTSDGENHASITLEINVYSNKTSGKKSECKKIISFIDEQLTSMNFTRTMLQPLPNLEGATIYRITGRYNAIISKDTIYRR